MHESGPVLDAARPENGPCRFDGGAGRDDNTAAEFATMSPPLIFDRSVLRARRRRALRLGPEPFLLDRVAEDFAERLRVVLRRFDVAADIGTPTAAVRAALARDRAIATMIAVEPSIDAPQHSAGDRTGMLRVVADEEALPFANASLDLAVSGLALQTVNDLPGVLVQIRRALKPDGLFLAALLGGDTLAELRHSFAVAESELEGGVSPRVAPFADVREMGALLQRAGFALPVTDTDRVTVRYAAPFDLLRDLRRMGAANPLVERRRVPMRRATLMRAMAVYAEQFADADGKVRASFDIIWLSGWSPHESQQQPLRPGSARVRLADALGTTEVGVGETPERR
jgi:SAM-dependent methyltransferase